MSDETTPLIFGDAIVSEFNRPPRRRWWRRKKKAKPPLTHCENCGASLAGPYCAQCGQPAIDYRRSFGSLMADAADAFFNLDARFIQSFGWLLFKPWRLTNEFIEGKRARHVHPLRVYLIASVTFFLVINFLAKGAHVQGHSEGKKKNFTFSSLPPVELPSPPPGFSIRTAPKPPDFALSISPDASPIAKAGPSPGVGVVIFDDDEDVKKMPAFGRWIEQRAKEKLGPTGDRGDLFLKALLQNLAPMVLCCIPLFALVLKILYIFKRRFYVDHLIFALHTHAFIFLSTVIIIGLGFLCAMQSAALTAVLCTVLGIAVIVQLLRAIRRVYRQNWLATLFKFAFGSVIYLVLLTFAFGITAFVTLLLP